MLWACPFTAGSGETTDRQDRSLWSDRRGANSQQTALSVSLTHIHDKMTSLRRHVAGCVGVPECHWCWLSRAVTSIYPNGKKSNFLVLLNSVFITVNCMTLELVELFWGVNVCILKGAAAYLREAVSCSLNMLFFQCFGVDGSAQRVSVA